MTFPATVTQWLVNVPSRWDVLKARRIFSQERRRAFISDEQLTASQHLGVVPQSTYMEQAEQKVVLALSGTDNFQHVEPGDFVISLRSFEGGVELSECRGCVSPAYTVLRAKQSIDSRYYKFLLKSSGFVSELQASSTGIRDGKTIRYSEFGDLLLPLPPAVEQHAIATFLDRRTARIDTLIAKYERLLELLEEKRQAVITRAVTKGLDPNVPMKDSGVEWLGEVPAQWEVGKLKHWMESLDHKRIPLNSEERADLEHFYPYYGASGIIDYVDSFIFDEALLLVGEDGANLVARGSRLSFVAEGRYWVNNHAHVLRPKGNLHFWCERLEALDFAPFVTGSAQPKLTIEALLNMVVSLPVHAGEQNAIGEYVRTFDQEYQLVISKVQHQIALLKEYRSTLITAAVTGKIDVREEVPADAGQDA